MVEPYYLADFTPDHLPQLLDLIINGGIDYPFWYRNGMTPDDAANEHMRLAERARTGESRDLIKAIRETKTNRLIGGVSLEDMTTEGKAEIGYFLHSHYQGYGIGSWAAYSLVKDAFENHGLHSMHTTVHPKKMASQTILWNLGFKQTGYIEKSRYSEPDGSPAPRIVVAATEEDIRSALATYVLKPMRPVPVLPKPAGKDFVIGDE